MRKLLLLSLFSMCYYVSSSQVLIAILLGDKLNTDKIEFGLMVSPTLTNLTNIESKAKTGLGFALYFNFKLSENLFFHPEASPKSVFGIKGIKPYATGNANIDSIFLTDDGASVQRNIKALSLPLLMRYRIKGLLFAELGPQIDWMIGAKDIFKTKVDDNQINYTTQVRDQVTRFDIGLAAGLEYKLKKDKGMGIGIRYYYGLTDVIKNISGNQKNTAWFLNIAIPIGVGAPKPKQ
jgi:hypothetical protein